MDPQYLTFLFYLTTLLYLIDPIKKVKINAFKVRYRNQSPPLESCDIKFGSIIVSNSTK